MEQDGEGVKESWRTFDDLRRVLQGTGTSSNSSSTYVASPMLSSLPGKVSHPFETEVIPMLDRAVGTAVSREREGAHEFMALLAVCDTVILEVRDGKPHIPDGAALVAGTELLGYQFHVREAFVSYFLSLLIDRL